MAAFPLVAAARPGPALSVDVAADRYPINPDIYGIAYVDPVLAKEIRLPIERWGGDGTTRYNWKINNTNSGGDWYFMAGGNPPIPSAGPDQMIHQARSWGGKVLLTIPIIKYIDKSAATNCSFPVSIFGPQQSVNPYVHPIVHGTQTNAGNGIKPNGQHIILTPRQKLRINMINTPRFQAAWVRHLVRKFGTTARGGVGIYELDNEPGGWCNTHRDVHPGKTGDAELVNRSIAFAKAIKSADHTAKILGPGDFMDHYQGNGKPGDGRKQHHNLGQGDYYLMRFARYQKKHGVRLLNYFDEHYYPTPQTNQTKHTELESTRSFWDPTYRERNWIGKYKGPIDLIPSFHRWVNKYYPGTKISISEYGLYDVNSVTDTLVQADALGIFARQRLDLASLWGAPNHTQCAANAFRIYRNYNGKGGQFGNVYVRSVSANQQLLAIYGAQRSGDHALTLVCINKTGHPLTSKLKLSHFKPASKAKVYRFTGADKKAIVRGGSQKVGASGFTATFPAKSITLFVIPQSGGK